MSVINVEFEIVDECPIVSFSMNQQDIHIVFDCNLTSVPKPKTAFENLLIAIDNGSKYAICFDASVNYQGNYLLEFNGTNITFSDSWNINIYVSRESFLPAIKDVIAYLERFPEFIRGFQPP